MAEIGDFPGRWAAVGFPYLYVMYRVLNEVRPEMLLEIGTGQTTKMIWIYLRWNADAESYCCRRRRGMGKVYK